jgi:cbb3-type cytochrome oxidase maturation protein
MLSYILLSLAMGIAGILIYVYYLRKGQFDDPEDVKYQLFREDEEQ